MIEHFVVSDETHHNVANATCAAVSSLLEMIAVGEQRIRKPGTMTADIGPIVSGSVGAIVEFILNGDPTVPADKLRADILGAIDCIDPQVRMDIAARGAEEGNA